MARKPLLEIDNCGIYCSEGKFHIDPWKPVDRAFITHGHSDHARWGMRSYMAQEETATIIKHRIRPEAPVHGVPYQHKLLVNGVKVSFHPAGHVVGSSQIRVEHKGEVWVVTGDFKLGDDHISGMFEPVKCNTIIMESTFGLPVFRWEDNDRIIADINSWWAGNSANQNCSVLLCYSLGKAQRILKGLDPKIGPILLHGATFNMTEVIRDMGYEMPPAERISMDTPKDAYRNAIVLAPGSVHGSSWVRKMQPYVLGNASGWMTLRGTKRRKAIDKGFIMSDHSDFEELNLAVEMSQAERVLVTHGYAAAYAKYQTELGRESYELHTYYQGEEDLEPETQTEEVKKA